MSYEFSLLCVTCYYIVIVGLAQGQWHTQHLSGTRVLFQVRANMKSLLANAEWMQDSLYIS